MTSFAGSRPGASVAVLCVAQFVLVLDATIVATALPTVAASLGLSAAGLAWVLTGYTLTFGGFLVLGGRVSDLAGPRRVLLGGLGLFALSSAGCALAWSGAVLVAARLAQGVGAALMSPAALSLLGQVTQGEAARRRAVGWWTAAAATGGASGWVVGGLLAESWGWRAVFWVNVPLGTLGLVAVACLLPPGRRLPRRPLDVPAAVGVTAALGLVVLALTVPPHPWSPSALLAIALAAGTALLVRRRERHVAHPLLPPGTVRGDVAGASLSALAITASTSPAMMLSAFYLQDRLGWSAASSSWLFPVFNLAVTASSLAGAGVLARLGPRVATVTGFGVIALGALVLLGLPGLAAAPTFLVAFAVMGAGLGVASVTSTHVGTSAAEAAHEEHEGVVLGVLTSAAQVGSTIGLALLLPLAHWVGYAWGFAGAAVVAALGTSSALLLPGRSASATDHGRAQDGQRDLLRHPAG